jgi:hypothetical protein
VCLTKEKKQGTKGTNVRSIDQFRDEMNTLSMAACLFRVKMNHTLQRANARERNEHTVVDSIARGRVV